MDRMGVTADERIHHTLISAVTGTHLAQDGKTFRIGRHGPLRDVVHDGTRTAEHGIVV